MQEKLTIIPLKISNNILTEYCEAITNHQQRYNVSKPSKWGDMIKLITNMRYITEEQWDQTAPLMSFDVLKYNYIYPHVDDWIAAHHPDKAGSRYHSEMSWYNIYRDEGRQVPHYHRENHGVAKDNADLVCAGVCYLHIDPEPLLTRIFNIYDCNPFEGGKVTVPPVATFTPKPADLYLFSPDLYHEAVQTGTGKSIVMAFNVFLME